MSVPLRAAFCAVATLSASAAYAQTLTLEDAIARAIAVSPQGAAATARLDALTAARAGADTRPAPTIDGTLENVGIGGADLNRQIQVDVTYNQRIERGGKRAARVGVIEGDIDVVRAEALVRRLDLAQAVQRLYVEVQAADINIMIARERVAIAQQLQREVQRRVDEARDPLFAGTRARTQLAEANVDLELAQHAREAALIRLALFWAGDANTLSIGANDFFDLTPPSGSSAPAPVDLAVFEARRRRADANATLQSANGRTDPTVFGGPRVLGTGDVAVVAGFSLPLANRELNRANIDRAAAEQRQVDADLAVERFERTRAIAFSAERVEEARHEAEAIRDRVVPGAQQTLREVRAGYARGGFTFQDVSSAQTALHDARVRMVRATTEYHQAKVELDRLTGRFATLVEGVE